MTMAAQRSRLRRRCDRFDRIWSVAAGGVPGSIVGVGDHRRVELGGAPVDIDPNVVS